MKKTKKPKITDIELSLIDEPKSIIRMEIDPDKIKDLAQSISEIGQLQPILLAVDNGRYEIVAGHCRYLAHKKLGLEKIKAVVRHMSKEEIGVARATENITRVDLTPIEEAATYKDLQEVYGMSIEKIAQKIGMSPGTIKRRMDLLRMPPQLQQAVHKKQVSMTVAEELWSIRDIASLEYYLSFAIENGCTREVARQWAKDWKDQERRQRNPDVGGGQLPLSPMEPRISYVPCDVCISPVDIVKSKFLRTCPDCFDRITNAIKGDQ